MPFMCAMLENKMRLCLWRWVIAFVVAVTVSAALPLSSSENITFHVQSQTLTGHRLVLTLEPIASSESPKSLHVTPTPSNDTTEQMDDFVTTPSGSDTTELPPTTTDPPTTTMEEATESDTTPPIGAFLRKSSVLPGDIDVSEFIISIPQPFCPRGYRPDPNGKCRQVFAYPVFGRGRALGSPDHRLVSRAMKPPRNSLS